MTLNAHSATIVQVTPICPATRIISQISRNGSAISAITVNSGMVPHPTAGNDSPPDNAARAFRVPAAADGSRAK